MSIDAARQHLNLPATAPDPGDELQRFLDSAVGAAELWKRRTFTPADFDEEYEIGARDTTVYLRHRPLMTVTSVNRVGGTPVDPDGVTVVDHLAGTIRVAGAAGRVRISYRAGYVPDELPAAYRTGVLMILAHLWRTQRMPASGRNGISRADDDTVRVAGWAIPRAAVEMLGPQGVSVS